MLLPAPGAALQHRSRAVLGFLESKPHQSSAASARLSLQRGNRAGQGAEISPPRGRRKGPGAACDSAEVTAGGPRSRDASSGPPAHYSPQHAPRSWAVESAASAGLLCHHRGLSRCLKPRPMVLRALPADWPGWGR